MCKSLIKICQGATIVAVPAGKLLNGWLPGTIINFVKSDNPKYIGIDLASEHPELIGVGGFILNGSYEFKQGFDRRFPNDNESSGYWTPDENVILSKSEENDLIEFDGNKQLAKLGKGLVTINFEGGCFKVYTFEKYDNEYLNSNGEQGGVIDWKEHIGELVGCSPRSLFTTIENNVIDEPLEYRVGGLFKDDNGEYILLVRR